MEEEKQRQAHHLRVLTQKNVLYGSALLFAHVRDVSSAYNVSPLLLQCWRTTMPVGRCAVAA